MRCRRAVRTLLISIRLGVVAAVLWSWALHTAQWHTGLVPMPAQGRA